MKMCIINIYVSDLDFAMEWYREVLDLQVKDQYNTYPIAVDVDTGNDMRLLLHKAEKDTNIEIWNESSTIITFEVSNLREKMKDLKERGVQLMSDEPQWFPDGDRIAFKDPFGNVHELAEKRSEADPEDRR
ncbi:VOC family protein [Pontibacillus salicampi]|uniref:VOC family protein n=1 Tax=Pontibacillus salicampi TaxID=1449801 RepID=A0ABV6LNQ4_9BACI